LNHDRDDATVRAHNFFQTILDLLFVLSSRVFQQRIWLGHGNWTRYVSDYTETAAMLDDFIPWLLKDECWSKVPLTLDQAARLEDFHQAFVAFDESLHERTSSAAMTDPRWQNIMASAAQTLEELRRGTHKMTPQFSEAEFAEPFPTDQA
jgi:hypothetical protein